MPDPIEVQAGEELSPEEAAEAAKHFDLGPDVTQSADTKPEDETKDEEQSGDEDRPDWLPEKYKTPEDLAAGYKELTTKLQQQGEELNKLKEGKSEDGKEGAAEESNPEALQEVFQTAEQEFAETGELSDETSGELAKYVPPQFLERYQEMSKALAAYQENEVLQIVGGREGFEDAKTWARQNMTEAELASLNKLLASDDIDVVRSAMQNLAARSGAQASDTRAVKYKGKGAGGATVQPFRSENEMVDAINDPRYAEDPAYRKDVQERVAISNL